MDLGSPIPPEQSKEVKPAEAQNTRWWESYLVRYFVGFIVGACCVGVLAIRLRLDPRSSALFTQIFGSDFKVDAASLYIPVALLGLGYCYVASTPITVLHLGRNDRWWLDSQSRHFWFGWLAVLLLAFFWGPGVLGTSPAMEWFGIAVSAILTAALPVTSDFGGLGKEGKQEATIVGRLRAIHDWLRSHPVTLLLIQTMLWSILVWCASARLIGQFAPNLKDSYLFLWLLAWPVIWIGIVQYSVLARLITDKKKLYVFYAKLFDARGRQNSKDVRDTYTHLREHSNAVFIVVVELAVLAFLLALIGPLGQKNVTTISSHGVHILAALAFWMLPTVFVWARANSMESAFAEDPTVFLTRPK